MMPVFYIGVDLGGTNIRAARFTAESHKPDRKVKHATRAKSGPGAVMDRIEAAIREAAGESLEQVAGVGIAAPGPVDPHLGLVLSAPNIPGWENVPLQADMAQRLGRPVAIGNDANLAALGEWRFGAGQGHADVLYLTISTGIGGGVVSGGRLLVGARGLAAEVGHMLAVPNGPKCSCGQRGHLEAVASGTSMARIARERLEAGEGADSALRSLVGSDLSGVTAAVVGKAALAGDAFAAGLIADAGTLIGRTLASLLHAYNPSVVIFGGGVSMLGDVLLEPVRAAARKHAMSEAYWRDCPIVQASLGDDAGLVGAGVLSMDLTRRQARPIPAQAARS